MSAVTALFRLKQVIDQMSKVLAYRRTSTDKQDLMSQQLELLEYARQQRLEIADFIAVSMSSRRTPQERRIDELLERLIPGDTLLVTELSRLGRSTEQVIHLIDALVKRGIRVVILKQNLVLDASGNDLHALTLNTSVAVCRNGTSDDQSADERGVNDQENAGHDSGQATRNPAKQHL